MPTINYVGIRGARYRVDVPEGTSVMRGAKDAGVDGMDADCGGACACATCHVYVDEAWVDRTGAPGNDENEMLDRVSDRRPNSRLSCQIAVGATLDGLVVYLPATQG